MTSPLASTPYQQFDEDALFDERIFNGLDEVRAFCLLLDRRQATLSLELPVRARPKALAPEERDLFHRRLVISTHLSTPLTGDPHDDAIRLMALCSDWTASLLINFRTSPDDAIIIISNDELLQSKWFVTYKATFEWADDLRGPEAETIIKGRLVDENGSPLFND